jgi:hypothetical protein
MGIPLSTFQFKIGTHQVKEVIWIRFEKNQLFGMFGC